MAAIFIFSVSGCRSPPTPLHWAVRAQLAINATLGNVDTEIRQLAIANGADDTPEGVEWELTASERGVEVVAHRTFESYFARIMGYENFTVSANAHAEYEPVTGTDGLFPLTLDCDCVADEYHRAGR